MKKSIELDEYKKIILDILIDIDSFCRENNIKYFLTGGTLIGAIRHKGFIPWDDDIDIALMRGDYERFIKTYSSRKGYYKLLSIDTNKKYNYPFAKVVDDRIAVKEDVPGAVEIGAYVDVFPVDNCPGNTFEKACKSVDGLKFLRWARNFKIIRFSASRSLGKNIILFFGKCLTALVTRRFLSKLISKKASKNQHKPCRFVAGLVNNTYGYGEVLDKKLFDEIIDVTFEGHLFIAPKNFDIILRSYYGNYMELPPLEKQISHHDFDCWYK